MTNEQILEPARPIALGSKRKRWFLFALLLSTWLPILFFIAVGRSQSLNVGVNGVRYLLLFLGTAHVPATLYFYFDREFSEIIRTNKPRYLYFPLLLTIGTGLLLTFADPITTAFVLLGYWGWQAFHYGRQNLGIYAFVSIAEGRRAARKNEKLAIDLATICGILGTFKVLGSPIAPAFLRGTLDGLYELGRLGFLFAVAFAVLVFAINIKNTTLLKSIFFFTLILFFGPVYLSDNVNIGFLSYAIAHGVQYIIFMSVVSANSEVSSPAVNSRSLNMLTFLVLFIIVGFIFWRAEDLRTLTLVQNSVLLTYFVNFVIGAILGATMAHFVIDAGAWKLSKTPQRTYMSKRFGFIFGAQTAGPSPKKEIVDASASQPL